MQQSDTSEAFKQALNRSVIFNVFEVYMLQVKVNRRNYNSYIVIYITWLRQSCYVFTMHIFIRLVRIDITYVRT